MSFLDSSHSRNLLWVFYFSAFLSALIFGAASYASVSYQTPLLVLALVTALAAAFFLVLFLRSRDERERQINYRALTFTFVSTLVLSLVVGLALSGQVKTGHMWSLQNRPYVARDLDLVPRFSLLGQA